MLVNLEGLVEVKGAVPFHRVNIRHVAQIQEPTSVPELDKGAQLAKPWRLPGLGTRDSAPWWAPFSKVLPVRK